MSYLYKKYINLNFAKVVCVFPCSSCLFQFTSQLQPLKALEEKGASPVKLSALIWEAYPLIIHISTNLRETHT